MDETILLPSPNWFLPSNLAVSPDGWIIYGGGTNKSLCVLEPLGENFGIISGNEKYHAHVVTRAHHDKVVSVDVSPEWLEKKSLISGSSDGGVKQWLIENVNNKIKIKATLGHDVHNQEKEEVVGVGYCSESVAISVGCFGNIVKWDLTSNVSRTYPNFTKNFKPTCMSCSRHGPNLVAVGTKQGIIFLIDLQSSGRVLYKVRGHDDEVMNVSWCPQYEVLIKKTLKESRSILASRLAAIQNEGKKEKETNVLEQSGIGKSLPDDSFDESIVQEDDMFDIYKDHAPDEFGHKKYEPEDIVVKVKKEKPEESDYLAECLKLKEDILRRKNQPEPTIESLVDALDNTHVDVSADAQADVPDKDNEEPQPETSESSKSSVKNDKIDSKVTFEQCHLHKQLLASVGKYGGIRIWSKSGKLVSSCAIPNNVKNQGKTVPFATTLLWYKPDSLLIADGKSQLLECNPLQIDCKNKLEWRIVHTLHKRGMYCLASNAPRVQTESTIPSDDWSVWSVSQDRNIIRYCLRRKKALSVHASCGGFVYTVQACPYDAGKFAVSVGDGAVRVCETTTLVEDDTKLTPPRVTSYWQNVQGKVLVVAWHPTRENFLAFGTAEARVGLIDTSSRMEKPARVLFPALNNAIYSLCWGEGATLYASGGGSLVMYRSNQIDEAPEQIDVTLEGQTWEICAVTWTPRGFLVGSVTGAVAVLTSKHPHTLITAVFLLNKMIHAMEWHPQQTSSSSEVSPYKDLIAVTSLDRDSNIIILEYKTNETDGKKELTTWKKLIGHKISVLQVAWNPHRDELLLSSSQDCTIRVWDISTGTCISIFGHHTLSSLAVCWVAFPQLPHYVMTGGGDACLRLWDIYQHKAEDYDPKTKHEAGVKLLPKKGKAKKAPESTSTEDQVRLATNLEITNNKSAKYPKKFLLPLMFKQINDPCKLPAPRKMLELYIQKHNLTLEKSDDKPNPINETGDSTTVNEEGEKPSVNEEGYASIVNEKGDASIDNEKGDSLVNEKEDTSLVNEMGVASLVNEKGDASLVNEKGDDDTEDCSAEQTDIDVSEASAIQNKENESKVDLSFLKIFGTIREVNEFLDMEMAGLTEGRHLEAWIMLSIFRGHIDTMIQFASKRDMLCPFLISMAPCVSFKYWKDATQLYLAQIDRLVARGEEEKLYESRQYGGPKYRKAAVLLSMHDVMGAVAALSEGKLFKEAYILCRVRYMDSVAEEILKKWAEDLAYSGHLTMAAVCYIALDNLSQAAEILSRSHDQSFLSLAADIAKVAGRTAFADHVEKKAQTQATAENTEEILKDLPSKIELLMRENKKDTLNGEALNSDNEIN